MLKLNSANFLFVLLESKDPSASSEDDETSVAMAQSGRYSHKLDESDDDFNSNQLSPDTATLSVEFNVSNFVFLVISYRENYKKK